MTRGGLLRYARYQCADYLVQRGLLPFALILLLAGIPRYAVLHNVGPDFFSSADGQRFALQMYRGTIVLFLPLGAFFAAASLLSVDRDKGYFRFLFAKPVSVRSYYLQALVAHGLLFVALFGGLTLLWGLVTVHFSLLAALQAAVLTWWLIGGLGFALGTLTRLDGAALTLSYVAATATQAVIAMPGASPPRWLTVVAAMLPPVHDLDLVRDALYDGAAVAATPLVHVAGYGLGAWIVGWIAVRVLSLQR